mgnify:CR=1 FL=1
METRGIDYVHLKKIDCDEKSVSRYLLQEGDVLIASKGTVKKIAVFAEQDEPVIASANIYCFTSYQRYFRWLYQTVFGIWFRTSTTGWDKYW